MDYDITILRFAQVMPGRERLAIALHVVASFGILVLTACARMLLLSDPPGAALTANLPLDLAGVRDEGAELAALFAREPAANGLPADPDDWLHSLSGAALVPGALHILEQRFTAWRGRTARLVVPGLLETS